MILPPTMSLLCMIVFTFNLTSSLILPSTENGFRPNRDAPLPQHLVAPRIPGMHAHGTVVDENSNVRLPVIHPTVS